VTSKKRLFRGFKMSIHLSDLFRVDLRVVCQSSTPHVNLREFSVASVPFLEFLEIMRSIGMIRCACLLCLGRLALIVFVCQVRISFSTDVVDIQKYITKIASVRMGKGAIAEDL
jgi:hypothetical protein